MKENKEIGGFMNPNTIKQIVRSRILVAGDFMLDKYISGNAKRISPEAPVPVLKVEWEDNKLGGGGNVVNNVASLSAQVRVLTCIGKDASAEQLLELLKKSGADTQYLYQTEKTGTITKTRVVAGGQQVVRIDREDIQPCPSEFMEFTQRHLDEIFEGIDVLILSDYGKGILSLEYTQLLIGHSKKNSIPVLVDPKGTNWGKYVGATACTPNLMELSIASGVELSQDMEEGIRDAAKTLCQKLDAPFMIVTRSERGISLIYRDGKKEDFPAKIKEVIDVSGAGDTVITLIALGLASGFSVSDCCRLANEGASVVVSKFGTATLGLHELIGADILDSEEKVITTDLIEYLADFLHKQGKRVVFTNGCFDLIHAGHISSFEQAKGFGDVLIVGVNSDQSVRKLKGDNRPVVSENNRVRLLKALHLVDYIVVFNEETPEKLICKIKPDVLVKGQDYINQEVVGSSFVESYGGSVELIELEEGLSTSLIIEKIIEINKEDVK